jgi:hypothetical protein
VTQCRKAPAENNRRTITKIRLDFTSAEFGGIRQAGLRDA